MGAYIAFLLASRAGLLLGERPVLLARLALRERLTPPRVIGLALALSSVALISAA